MIATTVVPAGLGPLGSDDADLLLRVSAEFHEMPDLVITVGEAARLFAVDRSRCRRILDTLVSKGVLTSDGRVRVLARAGTGRQST
jgi:hypothetical protein